MTRIQFILKARQTPFIGEVKPDLNSDKKFLSSGLLNSAGFVADMLRTQGHFVELVHAIDNNCIDRLVTKFKPDIVIIEAYWVVPEKFKILSQLHPKVKWIIRNHSALPFLANEGNAMDWSLRYMDYKNIIVACNDIRTDAEMRSLVSIYKSDWNEEELKNRITLLPNFYPGSMKRNPYIESDTINISCFGAMRPLKNHLLQAIAAIQYAKKNNKHLRFHVNGTRIEMKGEPIIHNLQKLFKLLPYELVEHEWLQHDEFCELLRKMDVAMQVSYTETFNIVSADAVVNGVPIITSPDILWSDPRFQANPNSSEEMVEAIDKAVTASKTNSHWQHNLAGIMKFSQNSLKLWTECIDNITKKGV